jgi:hypothetical protein
VIGRESTLQEATPIEDPRTAEEVERMADALNHAVEKPDHRKNWTHWVRIRDACEVGRAHRYSEQQMHFHYDPDVERLLDELDH